MAASHIQSTGIQSVGSVNSVAKAFTSNVTAGSAICVGGVTSSQIAATTAVTDSLTNAYTRAASLGVSADAAVYYALNSTGGACTVTFNATTGNDFQSVAISEFSGVATSSAIDGTNTFNANSSTPSSNVTTTAAGVIFGVLSHEGGATTITAGTGNGYAQGFEDEDASDMPIASEWKVTGGAGTYAVNWTLSGAQNVNAAMMGLKEAAGGGANPKGPLGNPLFGPFGGPI